MWPDKEKMASPEPRVLLEKEVYQSCLKTKKGIKDNLLIYGDNLLGLKALERDYTGKIKCIYIDPPYNTKSCFTHYDDSMEHSLWLNMMKDRLLIMHRLLSEDGSIWISIDDGECHYLKVMCDEIFGRRNFVSNTIWEKKYAPQNDAKWMSDTHDHILVFAKNKSIWRPNLLPRTEEMDARYKNPDNDVRGPWKSGDLSVKRVTSKDIYPIHAPSGREIMPPKGRSWAISKEKYQDLLMDKRIWFGPNDNNVPSLKRFLSEVQAGTVAKTIWTRSEVGDNQESKREVIVFNPNDVFGTPKPERLIHRILHLATNSGDLVLDSFAGSGTTGAVAHKMGRSWIMIELNPHCHTHIVPRLQKVIEGTDQGGITESVEWKGGGGFRLCELAPSLLERNNMGRWVISKKYNPIMLAEAVCLHAGFNFTPKKDPWWIHGYSTERDFIYVTSSTLCSEQLKRLSDYVGEDRTLLVYCEAFHGRSDEFANLTIEKIPKKILARCEWGQDDYSLKVLDALEFEAKTANKENLSKSATISVSTAAKSVRRGTKK
jgi:adenine-specific DNA-methyltransferase